MENLLLRTKISMIGEVVMKKTNTKRPKDCPKKDKVCPLEKTKYCAILTTLRKAGHGCCEA
jgi:hypothetical protein